ncbi:MAG: signal peptide peptidase SppA [Bacteroidales bacterium]|nr:signal peptide peptidase SppA [Bacteroidales bacterium]
MKNFLKTTLAVIIGSLVAMAICTFLFFGLVGSLAALGDSQEPVVPAKAILKIDFSTPVTELGQEDAMQAFQSFNFNSVKPLGILKAVKAIEMAATDPAIKFIYINPNEMNIGMANLEEVRNALVNFRKSGKAIISYADNFSQGGYYLASVSDKIYLNSDGSGAIVGLGSTMMFFKDLLDKLGIEVQLIRHGKFKAAAEQFVADGISKENYEQNKEMIDSIWETWTREIGESRDIDPAHLNALVDDLKLFSAESLKEHGLIDDAVTRDQMQATLCNLFGASKDKDLKVISLAKYAEAVVKPNVKAKGKIAVIYADGEITMSDPQGLSAKKFYPIIREIRQDSSIKAVVLRVNSPGGDAQAAEILNKELQLLRTNKPLIVSMGEYAASGGYWISANSEKIFADNTTITGSIGVFSMAMNYGTGLKKHLKVNTADISSNKHSNMLNGIDPLDAKEVAFMQGMVEDIYTKFTALVSEGRDLPVEYVDEVGQGRVWTGADALERRLADEKGGILDALNYAAASANLDDYRIVEYPAAKTSMEQFMEMLQGAEASVKAMADPEETLKNVYSKLGSEGEFRVYARHPYCYNFNY